VFQRFFQGALDSGGAFAAVDPIDGRILGSSRYFGFDPQASEIEIGWTFLARSCWGGQTNGEMKRLMLDHAFRFVEHVVFLIGPRNLRSRRAIERVGGSLAGVRTVDGLESVVYRISRPGAAAPTD
jgi:RimJ/RimL family protein N-acetyltransferase